MAICTPSSSGAAHSPAILILPGATAFLLGPIRVTSRFFSKFPEQKFAFAAKWALNAPLRAGVTCLRMERMRVPQV
jgi:hypothetical protein